MIIYKRDPDKSGANEDKNDSNGDGQAFRARVITTRGVVVICGRHHGDEMSTNIKLTAEIKMKWKSLSLFYTNYNQIWPGSPWNNQWMDEPCFRHGIEWGAIAEPGGRWFSALPEEWP